MTKKKKSKKKSNFPKAPSKWAITADVTIGCLMIVEAYTVQEAYEIAESISGEKWIQQLIGPESVEVKFAEVQYE